MHPYTSVAMDNPLVRVSFARACSRPVRGAAPCYVLAMYPLKALIIGCAANVLADLRRELTNLSVEIEGEFVDAPSCIAHMLANRVKDRLFIIHAKAAGDVILLERLSEAALGQPILALVDPVNDSSLMMRTMRAGAAQVVRLPLQIDDFRAAVLRIAVQFGHPASPCRAISVLGATEGCGATTVSINLASEIGRLRNAPCIIIESAVAFGHFANYLNIAPPVTIGDLLRDIDQIDAERVRRALTKIEDNLQVLAGSYRTISLEELSIDRAFKLLGYVKQLADVLVVDGRYACENIDFDFLGQIHQLILVAIPTIPSLASLKVVLASLAHRGCMAQQFVVINQFVSSDYEFSAGRIAEVLKVPHVFTIASDSAAIRFAENAGQTLHSAAPNSRTFADITRLAHAVLGTTAEPHRAFGALTDVMNNIGHALHVK
jgi:pilus assembly protein CpaE